MQMEFDLTDIGEKRAGDSTGALDSAAPSPDTTDEVAPWLEVDPTEFRAALKRVLKLARAKEKAEAVVSFEDEKIVIALPAISVRASAEGVWPGEARVPAGFVQGLARSLTATGVESGPWRLHVEGDRLCFGSYSAQCVWQDAGGHSIHLPADAPFMMLLRLSWSHTEEEIEQSGLTPVVDAATERMSKLVARAAKALGPLEISEEMVFDFVVKSMQEADSKSMG
ncbi:hypothetical protein HOK31_20315 [Candidatus Poribacteria bacterium]|jgi:hypothetical protein|nr:hypothetical protein [Candidatus Poribacteria bacterium]